MTVKLRRRRPPTRLLSVPRPLLLTPLDVRRICLALRYTVETAGPHIDLGATNELVRICWQLEPRQATKFVPEGAETDEGIADMLTRRGWLEGTT